MNINTHTESIIQEFLKYGTKESLTVDDFLKIRQQAVEESMLGIKTENSTTSSSTNSLNKTNYSENQQEIKPVKNSSDNIVVVKEEDEKKTLVQKEPDDTLLQSSNKKPSVEVNKKQEVIKETIEETIEEENSSEFSADTFSEDDFIRMMRSVED